MAGKTDANFSLPRQSFPAILRRGFCGRLYRVRLSGAPAPQAATIPVA
jgi:hypothetical protein